MVDISWTTLLFVVIRFSLDMAVLLAYRESGVAVSVSRISLFLQNDAWQLIIEIGS